MESITLDREVAHLKDSLMPRYAELIYNGYWFAPERECLQALIDASQATVNGEVRLELYKGQVRILGRRSRSDSLYDEAVVTFEDDAGAYDQKDAGFHSLEQPPPAHPRSTLRREVKASLPAGAQGASPVSSAAAKRP